MRDGLTHLPTSLTYRARRCGDELWEPRRRCPSPGYLSPVSYSSTALGGGRGMRRRREDSRRRRLRRRSPLPLGARQHPTSCHPHQLITRSASPKMPRVRLLFVSVFFQLFDNISEFIGPEELLNSSIYESNLQGSVNNNVLLDYKVGTTIS